MRTTTATAVVTVVVLVALGASCKAGDQKATETSPAPLTNPAAFEEGTEYSPRIDPSNFVSKIDNPYHPLLPGTTRRYEGESDGEPEATVVTVTTDTKEILGVTNTVVRDQVFVDEELTEDTFDWFAQDKDGNVWYFGEETKEYENGKVSTTAGSWEAGVNGARPGIVMLGSPRTGDRYRQEYDKGDAEDASRVVSLDGTAKVPFGSFEDVLITEDRTPLEPDIVERKYYARGIGEVMEQVIKGGDEVSRLVDVKPKPNG